MSSRRPLAIAVLLLVLVLASCGGGGKTADEAGKAPKAGAPSSQLGIPLPDGARAEPAAAEEGGEAYRVPEARLLDVNAFYERETDGKPLKGFAWCGGAGFSADRIVRIWKRSETEQLHLEISSSENGVLVKVRENLAASATSCPPSGPAEQPFEAP